MSAPAPAPPLSKRRAVGTHITRGPQQPSLEGADESPGGPLGAQHLFRASAGQEAGHGGRAARDPGTPVGGLEPTLPSARGSLADLISVLLGAHFPVGDLSARPCWQRPLRPVSRGRSPGADGPGLRRPGRRPRAQPVGPVLREHAQEAQSRAMEQGGPGAGHAGGPSGRRACVGPCDEERVVPGFLGGTEEARPPVGRGVRSGAPAPAASAAAPRPCCRPHNAGAPSAGGLRQERGPLPEGPGAAGSDAAGTSRALVSGVGDSGAAGGLSSCPPEAPSSRGHLKPGLGAEGELREGPGPSALGVACPSKEKRPESLGGGGWCWR